MEQAIKGMLPKSRLGRQMATKLKVYKGAQHPHLAQKPEPLDFHASNAAKIPGQPKPGMPIHHHMEGQSRAAGIGNNARA